MKTFLLTTLLATIFFGCSKHSAFSDFNLTISQEKSEDSIQSAKINNKNDTIGLLSAIHLNKVYPNTYNNDEYFYIYLYTKETTESLNFILNDTLALNVEELKSDNQFSFHLTSPTEKWKKYFLVKFKQQKKGSLLTLEVKNSLIASTKMLFRKEEN